MDLPARTDVAIVGGGFAGCATARALADRGVRALVLEAEADLGRHASGRGAGLGRQLAEDDVTSRLAIRGVSLTRERFATAWAATGGVLGFDDAVLGQHYAARAVRLDLAHEVIDRRAVLARWPSLTGLPLAMAIAVPGDGVIDVKRLLGELASGVDIAYGSRATRLDEGRITIAGRGDVAARVVVDATGAWAGALAGDPPLDVFKRHLFVVEAPARESPYFWYLGADELYLRADGGGVVVSPCDAEITEARDQEPAVDADARLHARLDRAAPAWAGARIARRWACQRAFTPDRQMRLGRDPRRPWLVWAAALGGHGATAAPAIGEVVADAVIDALGGATGPRRTW